MARTEPVSTTYAGWSQTRPRILTPSRTILCRGASPPLYRLLRHSLLVEMDRLSFPKLVAANVVKITDRPESELVAMAPGPVAPLSVYDRIQRGSAIAGFSQSLAPYLARLSTLAALPTAELDRRFGEALDTCSHRLDAWITARATARLWEMRTGAPSGCYLGGFGFVENVRPAGPRANPGGYVHAPLPRRRARRRSCATAF